MKSINIQINKQQINLITKDNNKENLKYKNILFGHSHKQHDENFR